MEVQNGIENCTPKHHGEKLLRARQVRDRLGGIAPTTLYRMWKIYRVLAPPRVINGRLYWDEADIDLAIQNSQRGVVRTDPTPTQAVAPIKATPAERAANARRGLVYSLKQSADTNQALDTPPVRRRGRPPKSAAQLAQG